MQRDSEESSRTIEQLKIHNEKLHKALDLLKERQASLVQAEKRRKLLPTKIKDDISPQTQSQNSLNMNIAISNIDLSDEDQEVEEDESITETETTVLSPRKLRLPSRKPDIRDLENLQPSNVSAVGNSWTRKTPKNQESLQSYHSHTRATTWTWSKLALNSKQIGRAPVKRKS